MFFSKHFTVYQQRKLRLICGHLHDHFLSSAFFILFSLSIHLLIHFPFGISRFFLLQAKFSFDKQHFERITIKSN